MGPWLLKCTAVAATSAAVAGCASSCGANADKLARLQRGMSAEQASAIMGCPGSTLAARDGDGLTTMEWRGPGSLFIASDLDFRDDRLLYYTTRSKLGF
jgi:hypothetical protein